MKLVDMSEIVWRQARVAFSSSKRSCGNFRESYARIFSCQQLQQKIPQHRVSKAFAHRQTWSKSILLSIVTVKL